MSKSKIQWLLWLLISIGAGGYFSFVLLKSEDKSLFLPGPATHGHHQIELACDSCHGDSWGGEDVIQDACVGCHADDLDESHDSHPKSKFTDPRNADRLSIIDARYCAACHVEHNEEIVGSMGVTLPEDFCFRCHESIGEDRARHKDLEFDSCASAGCHNYHDNRALYEDFLVEHAHGESFDNASWRASLSDLQAKLAKARAEKTALTSADLSDLVVAEMDQLLIQEWESSLHALSEVSCDACHAQNGEQWQNKPALDVCSDCHEEAFESFTKGKHGMRFALVDLKSLTLAKEENSLSPETSAQEASGANNSLMSPSMARLPMKPESHGKELNCNSCHIPHDYKPKFSQVEACLGCHDDEHSVAYTNSKHYQSFVASNEQPDSVELLSRSVTCATCHMPSVESEEGGNVYTDHNQNHNLRPNEKMIRSVCMNCHSLQFSLNALADEMLIKNNFSGTSNVHVESIDWSIKRLED